ncbi:MAG: hypothetical protein JXQ27_02530 [Acidobacteria bacterium]|nr:hypothetical protein [Acidobacteriota bacterium]
MSRNGFLTAADSQADSMKAGRTLRRRFALPDETGAGNHQSNVRKSPATRYASIRL